MTLNDVDRHEKPGLNHRTHVRQFKVMKVVELKFERERETVLYQPSRVLMTDGVTEDALNYLILHVR